MGDARPGHARRRRRGTDRRLVHARHAGRAARDAGRRRPRAGPGRWLARAAHRDHVRARRAVRRRGRRVPDPRPQRLRRLHVGRVGPRDRGGALPVPRGRVAAAVDARAAAAASLAQARHGDAGDRPDGRGRRDPVPGADAGPPGRRARPLAASFGECVWWLWRRRHAAPIRCRRVRRSARARAAAHGHRRGAHDPRPLLVWAALVAPNLPGRLTLGEFARLPARAARRHRPGRPAAPAIRVACWPSSRDWCWRARDREGPRHRVHHGLRPAVRPVSTRATWGSASRRWATRSEGERAPRGRRLAVLVAVLLALPALALLRLTRVAADHRGWALRAAAVLGVLWVGPPRPRRAGRLHERHHPRRPRGAVGPDRPASSRDPRPRDPPRPLPRHSRQPAADRPAGQGRPPRCSSRATAGSRSRARPSRPGSTPCSTGAPRS